MILVLWWYSVISLPKESAPDIKFWIISINTIYTWVNPEDIDSLITQKIEREIKDINGIKKLSSTSYLWGSVVVAELYNGISVKDTMVDIKDKIDSVSLPEDVETPFVRELSTENEQMFRLLMYWEKEKFSKWYLKERARLLKSEIEWKWWVTKIDIQWTSDYEVEIHLNKSKLETIWLTIWQIASILRSTNKNYPIWSFSISNLNYDFRIEWEVKEIHELLTIPISSQNGSIIKLSDVATITKKYKDESFGRLWFHVDPGYNYVSFVFEKKAWSDIFAVVENAQNLIDEVLAKEAFDWLKTLRVRDMAKYIKEDYESLLDSWAYTLGLVFFTLLLFIWIKESIIATFAIPLAFLITFCMLKATWLSMNFLTNFSLVLTLWIAIDTTIVIVEWAHEKMRLWFNSRSAILLALEDYKYPLIAWTTTTLVAFLPLFLLPWVIWKYLSYIPITVFSTLLAALFLALTINSALFLKFNKPLKKFEEDIEHDELRSEDEKLLLSVEREWKVPAHHSNHNLRERFQDKLSSVYLFFLERFMASKRARRLSIAIPVICLLLTFVFLSPKIGFKLFPQGDNPWIMADITWKTWIKTENLLQYSDKIEEIFSAVPEFIVYYVNFSDNKIGINVETVHKNERDRDSFEIEEELKKKLEYFENIWLDVSVAVHADGPPAWKAVWVKLVADSNKKFRDLITVSKDFEEYLRSVPGTTWVANSSEDSPWQFVFKYKREKLLQMWLSPWDISREIIFAINWVKAWVIKGDSDDFDIVLKYDRFIDNVNPNDVENTLINTPKWKIRFWDVAEYVFDNSIASIKREDTNIVISVEAGTTKWVLPWPIQTKFEEFAEKYHYPEGISFLKWWENEENKALIQSTLVSFFISILLIFVILVLQFNSYSQPAVILYSVILAILWVNIWLYATWHSYSMPFAIWFIALTWVVVNDAIILIDRINNNLKKNLGNMNAVLEAWRARLQPIILTTLTTLFWIYPITRQDIFWEVLWFTIIFWLFVGSLMTLFVIPALYYECFLEPKRTSIFSRIIKFVFFPLFWMKRKNWN